MNQHYQPPLHRRLKASSLSASVLLLSLISILGTAHASNIDDDLNYIGKAEDYDKVFGTIEPVDNHQLTTLDHSPKFLFFSFSQKAGLAMG